MPKKERATPNLFPKSWRHEIDQNILAGVFRAPFPVAEGSIPEEQLDNMSPPTASSSVVKNTQVCS